MYQRYQPQGCLHSRKHISPSQVQVVKCPPDGNCLFAALSERYRPQGCLRRRSSRSSSSNSSSDSSSSETRRTSQRSGGTLKLMVKPEHCSAIACEACGTAGHHKLADCPLVLALTHDGDVELALQTLRNLEECYRPQGCLHGRKRINPSQVQVVMCPKDGNCLFTALAVAKAICKNKHLPPFSDRQYLGARTRAVLLEQIESWQKKVRNSCRIQMVRSPSRASWLTVRGGMG